MKKPKTMNPVAPKQPKSGKAKSSAPKVKPSPAVDAIRHRGKSKGAK